MILKTPKKRGPTSVYLFASGLLRNSVTLLISPPSFFEGLFGSHKRLYANSGFPFSLTASPARWRATNGISRIGVRSWMPLRYGRHAADKKREECAGCAPSSFGGPISKGGGPRHPSETGQRTTPTTVSSIDLIGKQLPLLCAVSAIHAARFESRT